MYPRFFRRGQSKQDDEEIITVVSGLPRSGTSMMMRMLEAGGMSIMTDSVRLPDDNNPKGYYEFEQVKQMKSGNNRWVSACRGKVVKIISPLLQYLPAGFEYRVVFMQRYLAEILASQRQMLARQGESVDAGSDRSLEDLYIKHLNHIHEWLARQDNIDVLYLHYNELLENPQPAVMKLAQFLQPPPLNKARMLAAIESPLYRQRGRALGSSLHQA